MGLRKQPKDISAGNPQPKDRRFDERGNDLDSAIIQITVPENLGRLSEEYWMKNAASRISAYRRR
jgi:hypothetical protein